MNLPTIPPELVSALDKLIPARCPSLNETDREIWLYAGKRSVVEFLKQQAELQSHDLTRSIVPST
jgi:hypothetical protein